MTKLLLCLLFLSRPAGDWAADLGAPAHRVRVRAERVLGAAVAFPEVGPLIEAGERSADPERAERSGRLRILRDLAELERLIGFLDDDVPWITDVEGFDEASEFFCPAHSTLSDLYMDALGWWSYRTMLWRYPPPEADRNWAARLAKGDTWAVQAPLREATRLYFRDFVRAGGGLRKVRLLICYHSYFHRPD